MKQRIKNLRFAIGVLEQLQAEGPYDYSKEIADAKNRLSELQSKTHQSKKLTNNLR